MGTIRPVEAVEEGEFCFLMEILRGSSSREETSLPFINKSYLKSYPAAIFKQLIMQTPPHANGMPAFVLRFKGWPGLLSNLHKERAPQRPEISTQRAR